MSKINPEKEFPKVEKMLYNLAWKCSETYPVSFEEARSEAYYAFMRACNQYDPTKTNGGKFTSWVYFRTWTDLKTWITKRTIDPLVCMELDDDLTGTAPPVQSESLELVKELSSDAQEICNLLVETPSELLDLAPFTPRQLLKRVKEMLAEKGWERNRVERAHVELQTSLRRAWAA